jgi:hypothetical protein
MEFYKAMPENIEFITLPWLYIFFLNTYSTVILVKMKTSWELKLTLMYIIIIPEPLGILGWSHLALPYSAKTLFMLA